MVDARLLDVNGKHRISPNPVARDCVENSTEDDLERNAREIASRRLLDRASFRDLGQHYRYAPTTIHRRLTSWLQQGRFELIDRHDGAAPHLLGYDEDLENALVRKTS